MAIEAKAVLLNRFESTLSGMLTANQMNDVLSALSDELVNYQVLQSENVDELPDDFLDAFLSAKEIEGRSVKTLDRYKYIISKFNAATNIPTREITVFHIRRYLTDMKTRGLSDSTLEGIREVFSSYFNWLQRENLIKNNPCANLGAIKCQKKVKLAYSEIDLELLKLHCKRVRDKAIICFLLSTGCRISEMTQLNRNDVDLKNRECKVLGKGNKERIVYIDSVTAMTINEYLKNRTDDSPALFAGKGTERLKPHGIRQMLKNLQDAAHIETTVHPHRFRRTLATNLIHRGMPIQEVAKILGHEKLDTTMKYICINDNDIKYSYNKYM